MLDYSLRCLSYESAAALALLAEHGRAALQLYRPDCSSLCSCLPHRHPEVITSHQKEALLQVRKRWCSKSEEGEPKDVLRSSPCAELGLDGRLF